MMSFVMLKGSIFSKTNSWFGIIGSLWMLLYVILVNFGSGVEKMATAFAMPDSIRPLLQEAVNTRKSEIESMEVRLEMPG
jgi:hypothetical protein